MSLDLVSRKCKQTLLQHVRGWSTKETRRLWNCALKTVKRQAGIVEGMRWLAGRPRRVVDFFVLFQMEKDAHSKTGPTWFHFWGDLFYPCKFNTTSPLKSVCCEPSFERKLDRFPIPSWFSGVLAVEFQGCRSSFHGRKPLSEQTFPIFGFGFWVIF